MKLRDEINDSMRRLVPEWQDIAFVLPGKYGLSGVGSYLGMVNGVLGPHEFVLNPRGIWRECGHRLTPRARARHFRTLLFGVVCHEIGHLLARTPLPPLPEHLRDATTIVMQTTWSGEWPSVAATLPPWTMHDARFVRSYLHVTSRARAAGHDLQDEDGIDNEVYALSTIRHYRRALGDEPERLADVTVREILKTQAPQAFEAMFATDKLRFYAHHNVEADGMITEVMNELEQEERKETATFLDTAKRIASGEPIPSAGILAVLKSSGKTREELRQAAELILRRRRWADQLDAAAKAQARRSGIVAEIAKADAELRKAQERHAQFVAPLGKQLRDIERLTHDASTARRELQRTCQDGDLLKALADATAERNDANNAVAHLEREARRVEAAKAVMRGIEYTDLSRHVPVQEQARQHTAAAEKAEAELPEARKRLEQAEHREKQLRARLLEP